MKELKMKIVIEVIPHAAQRYPTVGDWYWEKPLGRDLPGNVLHIKVSDTHDWRESLLIAIHELVEAAGCSEQGITQEAIDKWDFDYDGEGEPGDHPKAPYHSQHTFATAVERQVAEMLRVNWADYSSHIEQLFSPSPTSDDDIPF
jgi:hypothetical protein